METINNYITINTQNLKVIKNTFMEIIQSKVIYNIESNILLQLEGSILNIVATEGRQMAVYKINYQGNKKLNNAIIPAETIKSIIKNVSNIDKDIDTQETVNISINKECIQIIDNDYIYTSALIDSKYPPYKKVIPSKENEKYKDEYKKLYNVILDNKQMIEIKKSIQKLKKINKTKSKCIVLRFNKNNLILTVGEYKNIENMSNIVIDNINSNIDYTLTINHDFLLNILSMIINKDNDNKCTLEIYKKSDPIKIIYNNNIFVIMPFAIDNMEEINQYLEEFITNIDIK